MMRQQQTTVLFVVLFVSCCMTMLVTHAQLPAPTGVCYHKDKDNAIVEAFCRSVETCNENNNENCYMPCQVGQGDASSSSFYDCSDYDMECYSPVMCFLPPVTMMNSKEIWNNRIGNSHHQDQHNEYAVLKDEEDGE